MGELTGKHISRTQDDIQLAGSNASAEEADEGTDSASESGVDIILNHRLVETGFGSKKDFTVYLKDLQFYTGESMEPSAMILMLEYRDVDGEEKPILMGFKHGLREVKC